MSLLAQVKAWRSRILGPQDDDRLNEQIAICYGTPSGAALFDYLMMTYFCATVGETVNGASKTRAIELNAQRLLVQDLLNRVEAGNAPRQTLREAEEVFDARR